MNSSGAARRRAVRAVVSALAGGGLTAAALGGPLSGNALAASMAGVPVVPEGSTGSDAGGGGGAETGAAAPTPAPAPTTTSTTTPTTTPAAKTAPATSAPIQEVPQVVLQRRQKTTAGTKAATKAGAKSGASSKENANNATNDVAGSPQAIAQSAALAAVLASSQASVQALSFYRVPLFLLPIYKAAAVQYGIPWQILAAINEIETDFGNDQSVSSAGAEGWMQFMPSTWLQYGVDALEAGYADPYNPVDAIFAAARYLRAAGAQQNMRAAILAYNHSEEYADSVILRAKLISTYPKPVVATLTGLVDGRLPVTGKLLSWGALPPTQPASSASSTAASSASSTATTPASATPGSSDAPTPAGAVAAAAGHGAKKPAPQLVDLVSAAKSNVVAVQDGRVTAIGSSRALGRYVVLRDVYGDEYTYAGLGSVARTFTVAKPSGAKRSSQAVQAASTHDPAPSQAATAGTQAPVTLQVQTPAPQDKAALGGQIEVAPIGDEAAPAGMDRPRLFADPDNPDERAAAKVAAVRKANRERAQQRLPLRKGSVVTAGTVLGTVATPRGASAGHLRFAIRPAGDDGYVDPGPILANWGQLQKALHPRGATAQDPLLGATAGDVFLLSKAELQRTVLSDPGITIYQCGRQDIASGKIDQRVLAVLAYLSRSGLQPTVTALRCGQSQLDAAGQPSASSRGDSVEISAINGIPLARHQGPGTITDLTIRALLTLPSQFVPHEILSLMHYPGSANTRAERSFWNRLRIDFEPASSAALNSADTTLSAHSATKGKTAPVPVVTTSTLTAEQWSQLVTRIAALPTPKVETKPTSAAIPDPKQSSR